MVESHSLTWHSWDLLPPSIPIHSSLRSWFVAWHSREESPSLMAAMEEEEEERALRSSLLPLPLSFSPAIR